MVTFATYDYGTVPYGEGGHSTTGVILKARDTRASSPMQSIAYDYNPTGRFAGQVLAERYLDPVTDTPGPAVSTFTSNSDNQTTSAVQTETRGDAPVSRTIRMEKLNGGSGPPFVTKKSDYNGVKELYTYNANFFLHKVTDRNGYDTTFTLESVIGNVTRKTHPDNTHSDYTYTDSFYPYYIATAGDENGKTTTYLRNPVDAAVNPNMIYQINYPDGAFETFEYNDAGQVVKHRRRKSGTTADPEAYDYADYDSSGLMTTLWNPTTKSSRSELTAADPHTSFTYYPAGHPWQDRAETVTDPNGNATTYEFRSFSGRKWPNVVDIWTSVSRPRTGYEGYELRRHF